MDKLDMKIDSLTLSTRTYNAVIRGLRNLYRKDEDEITIRDLLSLNYEQVRRIRNLGNRGFSELLTEVHLLGKRFSFELEDNFNNNIVPTTMEDCLFMKKKYLTKIKQQQEQIKLIQEEIAQLESKKNIIDGMILMLKENENLKKL